MQMIAATANLVLDPEDSSRFNLLLSISDRLKCPEFFEGFDFYNVLELCQHINLALIYLHNIVAASAFKSLS